MRDWHSHLEDLLERIARIEHFTADGRETFMTSKLIQDGVIRNFEVIGEIVKRLPPELTAPYSHIPWRQIAGFRDILIHDYEDIELEIVWQAVEDDLTPLRKAVEMMMDR